MELRRCTRGTLLCAVLLLVLAAVLDDPAVFFAGSAILAGIITLYLGFDRRCRDTVRSVVVSRSLERARIRAGTTTGIATDITLRAPPRMEVGVAELLPPEVAVQDGTTSLSLRGSGKEETHRIRYRVIALVHGTLPVRGISLTCRDLFFQKTYLLSADRYSGPPLQVLPQGTFAPHGSHSAMEREIEKLSAVRGFAIRSMREYYTGDNLRHIDWKLSAKHDKLFIREYTGLMNQAPVLMVDLPWSGLPFSLPEYDRMVQMVAGLAEHSVRNYHYFTLVLVSGPNIVQVIEEERDLQQGMALLREWLHPSERVVHWYRMPDRSAIRKEIQRLDRCIQEEKDVRARSYFAALQNQYLAVLPSQWPTTFATDLMRVFSHLTTDSVVVFSLCEGDCSHIQEIIRQAKLLKFGVHLRTPSAAVPLPGFGRFYADSVEAFS